MTGASASGVLTYPVAALLAEPAGSRRDFTFDGIWLDMGDNLELAAAVAGRVRFSRTSRGLFITGLAETALALTCGRCLRPIELPLTVAFSEEALPTIDLVSGKSLDPSIEPEIIRLTDHHEVQLEPVIREAVQLGEPIAPVCRPDCPGLCIVCGEALENGPHEHDEALLDPRLEVLRAFRVDGGGETG